jgi:hypothetical protein
MRTRKVKLEGPALREAIDRCQKLFYFDVEEGDQIHLKTDASDYGIGAYLYILRKGVEIPIRFLSRSLATITYHQHDDSFRDRRRPCPIGICIAHRFGQGNIVRVGNA